MSAQDNAKHVWDACYSGNFALVRSLVGCGASVDFQCQSGHTSAILCCSHGYPEILQFIIEQGADADLVNSAGWSPLHYAVGNKRPQCTAVLLRHRVALDARCNAYGRTALWFASINGQLPVVKLLVEGGADIDRAANDGRTPLAIARQYDRTAVAKYLVTESKWRRVRAWAMVRSSVKGAPTHNKAIQVLQCDDMAREIQSYL
jgi:ankyrin repeat protein